MSVTRVLLAILICAGMTAACSSTRQRAGDAADFGRDETVSAVEDAVGLPRERPGAIMVDEGDVTVPTPYGGDGARRRCSTVAQDIARLTIVLGEDDEARPRDSADEDEDGTLSRGGRAVAGGARDFYRSMIVGLNPVRPVVRFVGRANEIESAARRQREMAQKRRAYLRGLYDGFGCPPSYLRRAFDAYGLTDAES
ncbi:MAG: hypothetical protein KIS81_10595 [Maricaulaceae bacterium]|nr:hypothetical protein [Maricaulaceae bacterium]